jgi:hypothetical protein
MNNATLTTWAASIVRPQGLKVAYEWDKLRGHFHWTFRQNGRLCKAVIDPRKVISTAEKIIVDNSK